MSSDTACAAKCVLRSYFVQNFFKNLSHPYHDFFMICGYTLTIAKNKFHLILICYFRLQDFFHNTRAD